MGLVPLTIPAHVAKQRRAASLIIPPVTTVPSSPRLPALQPLRTRSGISEEPVSPLSGGGSRGSPLNQEMADTFLEFPESPQPPDPIDQAWMDWYSLWNCEPEVPTVYDGQTEIAAYNHLHEAEVTAGRENPIAELPNETEESVAIERFDAATDENFVNKTEGQTKKRWGLFGMLTGGIAVALVTVAHKFH